MKTKQLLHYRIIGKISEGGQGTVYRAVDTKLGRTVAIKVLPAELTAKDSALKRFEREARLASALDHHNICTIFDLNQAEGRRFIVMQYVEGRDVRKLVGGKPLELRSALSIAVQTADALAAAHAQGIIHRDIKPGNVMVTDEGHVKVLDFGLAKLLDENTADKDGIHRSEITEFGVPYGTAASAAPEQAAGRKVDRRADIFSTGVLLYEMLTGTWPFQGKSVVEVRYAVLHDEPRPLAEFRSDLPTRLQGVLDRALAKDPDRRYQRIEELRDELLGMLRETGTGESESEFTTELVQSVQHRTSGSGRLSHTLRRWLSYLTGGDLTRGVASTSESSRIKRSDTQQSSSAAASDTGKRSLAILPFHNLSNDPEESFYEFSLADAVITELGRLRRLIVRPSSLIAQYQGQRKDPREIGRELNVNAVLSASFLSAGDRFRVNVQLLDLNAETILWSDRIDAVAGDIIKVQDTITRRIVEGLRLELSDDEQTALERRPTENAEAYGEYLRGRDRLARYAYRMPVQADFDKAIEHFRRAVALDERFAPAYSGIGVCHTTRIFDKLGSAQDYELAEEAFNRALDLDPRLFEARLHMVFIYLSRGDKRTARDEVERLLREAPNDAAVHRVAANLYRLDGRRELALRHFALAAALNPEERVNSCYHRARIFVSSGRTEEALRELDEAAASQPDHPLIKTFRAFHLYYRGELEAAAALVGEVIRRHPDMESVRPLLAMCLSRQGHHTEARAQLTESVKESADTDPDIAYWLASAYALEGLDEDAFEWLARAISLGREDRAWFETDPDWEHLRDNPRFSELMRQIET